MLAIGRFINAIIKFLIVAMAIFWLLRILTKLRIREPAATDRIRHEDPAVGIGEQPVHEGPALLAREVDLDRGLAAIEPGPVQARTGGGERPSRPVGRAAPRIDPDDLRTHVGKGLGHAHILFQ